MSTSLSALSELTRMHRCLDRLECPRCAGVLARDRADEGDWTIYRCACGFRMDRREQQQQEAAGR